MIKKSAFTDINRNQPILTDIHLNYNSNSHCLEPICVLSNNRLVFLRILSYRESTEVAPIS